MKFHATAYDLDSVAYLYTDTHANLRACAHINFIYTHILPNCKYYVQQARKCACTLKCHAQLLVAMNETLVNIFFEKHGR